MKTELETRIAKIEKAVTRGLISREEADEAIAKAKEEAAKEEK